MREDVITSLSFRSLIHSSTFLSMAAACHTSLSRAKMLLHFFFLFAKNIVLKVRTLWEGSILIG